MNLFLQLLAHGVVNGALFAVLAVSFGLVYRSARVFHIAFAGLFLLGPYTSYTLSSAFGFAIVPAVLGGMVIGGLGGWGIERALYRPFLNRQASHAAIIVASLGAYVVLVNLFALGYGNEVKTISRGLSQRVEIGPVGLTVIQLWQFALCGLALLGLGWAIVRMRVFRILWAMGDEPELVPILGLPMNRYRALVFILSGALSALAGCLIGYDVGIDPHMGMTYLLVAAVSVLFGGVDSYRGWILGGFVLAILQSLTIWQFSARWMDLSTFTLLIVILLFRPQGVLGTRKRLEEI